MTNAEQIALYWKQVEAIEEERAAVDAKLEEQADAIRAKIRALKPPPSAEEQAFFARWAERMMRLEEELNALSAGHKENSHG